MVLVFAEFADIVDYDFDLFIFNRPLDDAFLQVGVENFRKNGQ